MKPESLLCVALIVLGGCSSPALVEFRGATTTFKRTGARDGATSYAPEVQVGSEVVISNDDFASATPSFTDDGRRAVDVTLTDEGARKMLAYTSAHLREPIAIMLDGQLLDAPMVLSPLSKSGVISAMPSGLSQEQVDRIVQSLNRH